ncbi:hypothetical protein GCM10010104_64510 [Streptomyces indiaensis]|uniref:Uncharacterized protein n=1 Tax=Streptomyces indiaensis TaxID=284033 RepID=A0ABN3EHT7_9ACTN
MPAVLTAYAPHSHRNRRPSDRLPAIPGALPAPVDNPALSGSHPNQERARRANNRPAPRHNRPL